MRMGKGAKMLEILSFDSLFAFVFVYDGIMDDGMVFSLVHYCFCELYYNINPCNIQ